MRTPPSAPESPGPLDFTTEALSAILPAVRRALNAAGEVAFRVPDPDLGVGLYAGERTEAGLHRPWQTWADLAELLGAHLLTPERAGEGRVLVRLRRHRPAPDPDAQGYGGPQWARVGKLEDPVFLHTLTEALRRVNPPDGGRVLSLGVNGGQELEALALAFPERGFEVWGVDLDAAALARAKAHHPRGQFVQLDLNDLPSETLGRFHLVLCLSVLQSPGVRTDRVLAALYREHLTPNGGLVLGFPNARYRDGVLSYGARVRNYARPDLSLLCADVTDARRRLQKVGFKVFVTGKYEVLVTAIPATAKTPENLEV